jgi:UTP--glucose-1-phosphate uridylyltransferase
LIQVKGLIEKPVPENAPSNLAVVGRYIIEPGVFAKLAEGDLGAGGEVQLTDALASRIGAANFTGLRFSGKRFDCGSKIGFIKANVAFALEHPGLHEELQQWLAEQMPS